MANKFLEFFGIAKKQLTGNLIPGVPVVINNQVVWVGQGAEQFIDRGYLYNSIVYSIVRLIAKKCAMVPLEVYEVIDEKSLKKYKTLTSQDLSARSIYESSILKSKALQEVKGQKINDILLRPNPNQSMEEFIETTIMYKLVTGNSFIWGVKLENGLNAGSVQEMYNINPQVVTIKGYPLTGTVISYMLNAYEALILKPEDVLHLKYPNPQFNYELYGLSPLQAASRTLTRSNSAVTASVSQLQNSGPAGILSDKSDNGSITEEQARNLRLRIKEEYFGPDKKGDWIISGGNLQWVQLGLSPVDLDIIEQEKWSLRDLCNIYGISSSLMNDPENKTYNNAKEAQMGLINNCVMPEMNNLAGGLTRWLNPKGGKYIILPDYSVFTELQEDLSKLAQSLSQMTWLTQNEKRIASNYAKDENPLMDRYLVPMGNQFLEDMEVQDGDLEPDSNKGDF